MPMSSVIRKYFVTILIFIIFSPAILPLFKEGFFDANDAVWHIARFWQFHLSFSSGQIPVRWAPTLFYGLGYPAFIFNFHLPYYLMEIIYRLGFGLVDTYKIILGLSVIVSGFTAFLFLRSIFSTLPAIVGSLFFVYSPYRFATLYSRGAIGEALAIAIVPLVFWLLELFRKGGKYGGPLFAFVIFLLIITHPFIFLMFAPMILLYLLLFSQKKIEGVSWFLIGCVASSFAIFPYFFERKYLVIDEFVKNIYLGHLPNLFGVFRIPLVNADLGTPFQIGIVNWLVVLIAAFTLWKFKGRMKRNLDNLIKLSVIFFAVGIFLMSRSSLFLWEKMPFLSTILYPWRFINLLVFISAICAAFLIYRLKNNLTVALILIISVVYVSRHWWGWVGQIPTSDEYYKNYQEITTAAGEFIPRDISPIIENFRQPQIEIIEGEAKISKESLVLNNWQFHVDNGKDVTIKLALLNFPGWRVSVDGKETEIIRNYVSNEKDLSGLILFEIGSGTHDIKVNFGETKLRLIADLLSLLTLTFLFLYLLPLRTILHSRRIWPCKK